MNVYIFSFELSAFGFRLLAAALSFELSEFGFSVLCDLAQQQRGQAAQIKILASHMSGDPDLLLSLEL